MQLRLSSLISAVALLAAVATAQGGITTTFGYDNQGRPNEITIQSTNACIQTIFVIGVVVVAHTPTGAKYHSLPFEHDESPQYAEAQWNPPGLPLPPDDMHHIVIVRYRYYNLCTGLWVTGEAGANYYAG